MFGAMVRSSGSPRSRVSDPWGRSGRTGTGTRSNRLIIRSRELHAWHSPPTTFTKTGVSPLDSLDCPSWPPRRSRSSKLQGKTWSRPRSEVVVLQGHNCRVSGRISMRPHPSGTTRITVQRSLGTAQRLANPALGSTAGRIARGGGALFADAPACDLAGPRGMGSVSRAETEPGQRKCSAESSERSSLATSPEPRRDRLGSLPTPHPRFPPPSIPKIGGLLAAGQTHDTELSLCLIGWAGDQRPRGRPADMTISFAGLSEGSRLPASTPVRDLTRWN
jgi:hypothetical protein